MRKHSHSDTRYVGNAFCSQYLMLPLCGDAESVTGSRYSHKLSSATVCWFDRENKLYILPYILPNPTRIRFPTSKLASNVERRTKQVLAPNTPDEEIFESSLAPHIRLSLNACPKRQLHAKRIMPNWGGNAECLWTSCRVDGRWRSLSALCHSRLHDLFHRLSAYSRLPRWCRYYFAAAGYLDSFTFLSRNSCRC